MAKNFKTLREKMSPEARAQSSRLAAKYRSQMPLDELRSAGHDPTASGSDSQGQSSRRVKDGKAHGYVCKHPPGFCQSNRRRTQDHCEFSRGFGLDSAIPGEGR